jgi:MraZ protein
MSAATSSAVLFSGTFERSIDAKNRVTIPSRWLGGEEQEFHLLLNTNPQERFLMAMPTEVFAKKEAEIWALDLAPAQKRKLVRRLYAEAQTVTCDRQGRILLPDDKCAAAGLQGEVVLLGTKDRFEIWSKDRWSASMQEDAEIYEGLADLIGL